jgi:hypothetical protein
MVLADAGALKNSVPHSNAPAAVNIHRRMVSPPYSCLLVVRDGCHEFLPVLVSNSASSMVVSSLSYVIGLS